MTELESTKVQLDSLHQENVTLHAQLAESQPTKPEHLQKCEDTLHEDSLIDVGRSHIIDSLQQVAAHIEPGNNNLDSASSEQLAEMKQELGEMTRQRDSVCGQNETLHEKNETLCKENETLCNENETLCNENKSLLEKNETLCNENESLRLELIEVTDKVEEQVEKMQTVYAALVEDNDNNLVEVKRLSTQLRAAQTQCQQLQTQLTPDTGDTCHVSDENRRLDEELWERKIEDLRKERVTEREELRKREKETEGLKKERATEREELREREREIEEMKKERATEKEWFDAELQDWQCRYDALHQESRQLKKVLSSGETDTLTHEFLGLQRRYEQLVDAQRVLQCAADEHKTCASAACTRVHELEARVLHLEHLLQTQTGRLETLKAQYEEQVASLKEELEHERSATGRLLPLEAAGGAPETTDSEDKTDETRESTEEMSHFLQELDRLESSLEEEQQVWWRDVRPRLETVHERDIDTVTQKQLRLLQEQHEEQLRAVSSRLEQEHKSALEQLREQLICQYQEELEEVQRELEAQAEKMKNLEEENVEWEKEKVMWAARMEDLKSSLEEEHQREIEEVLEETKEAFEEEHARFLQQHEALMDDFVAEREKEVSEMNEKHNGEMQDLQKVQQDLVANHQVALHDQNESHHVALQDLEAKLNEANSELTELHEKHDQDMEQLRQSHDQVLEQLRLSHDTQLQELKDNLQREAGEEAASRLEDRVSELKEAHQLELNHLTASYEGRLTEKDDRMKKTVTEMQLFAQEQREEQEKELDELRTLQKKELVDAVEKAKQELMTSHMDELAAARLDAETSIGELDKVHAAELDELTQRHTATVTALTTDLTARHDADMVEVTARHDKEVTELTSGHEQVTSELRERHLNETNNLRTETGDKMAELTETHEREMAELTETHEREMAEREEGYESEMAEREERYEREMAEREERYEREKADMEARHMEHEAELTETAGSDSQLEQLPEQVGAKKEELEQLQEQLRAKEDKLEQLQSSLKELRSSLETANAQALSELRRELEGSHREQEERREEKVATQLLQLRTELEEEKQAEIECVQQRLEAEIAMLRQSLETVSDETDTERHLLERIAVLTEQHMNEVADNEDVIDKLRSEIVSYRDETERYKEKISTMEVKLSERDSEQERHLLEKEEQELLTSRLEQEDAERDGRLKMLQSDIDRLSTERDDIFMSNERLLRLLSDLVQSNLHTEDRISRRLVTLVNQSAGHSPQGGGADRGADRGVSDNGSGDEAAGGGASLAPGASELTPHNTSVTSGVSDEGLDMSQRITDTIFSGPELDPEVEEVVTDAGSRLQAAVDRLLDIVLDTSQQLHDTQHLQNHLAATLEERDVEVATLTERCEELEERLGEEGRAKELLAMELNTAEGLLQGYRGEREEQEERLQSLEDSKEGLVIELEQTKRRLVELEAAHSDLDARSDDLARQRAEWEQGIGAQEQVDRCHQVDMSAFSGNHQVVDDAGGSGLVHQLTRLTEEKRDMGRQSERERSGWETERRDLEMTVEELHLQIERAAEESKEETDELQRQIEATNKQLAANRRFLEEQSVEREVERDELQQKMEQLEKLKRDSETQHSRDQRLERELQELEEQLREKTDQVSTQKQRLEQLERSDTEQKTTLVELRDVISQLEAELEAASDSVTTVPPLDQETADLEVSGGDSQTDREELSHSITDLEAQVDTLRRAESLALEKVTTLEDELKNLKTLEEELTHDKAALQCRVDRQMTQMSALKAQLEAVKVTEAGDSGSSAVLPSMSPSLQHQLEQERDALTHSSKEAADLTEQLEQFREQLIERDEQLHQMEAQVVVSEKRCQHVNELEDKIQQLQAEVNRLTQEHGQEAFSMPVFAQQLIDEKNAEIDHLNEHILQLQAVGDVPSHSDTGAAGNVIADTNDERIETLQTHLTGAQEELRATQEELRATQEQLGAAEREGETAQEELSLLQRKQTEKELNIKQQVEALEHEMTQLRTEHDHYRVDMEQSLATVNAALGQKDTQLTQVEEELKAVSDTLEKERSRSQAELEQLQDQLRQANQSRQATDSSHQVAVCRLEDTLRQKEAETSTLTHELAEMRERLERAEEGRGQLERYLEELKETLSERQREMETLAQQLHNIQHQTDGIMANTQARYEREIQQLEEQLKDRDTRMDKTVSSHLESQRDLGAALVDAKRTIQGQEQQIRSLTSTECDLQHKVSDLRREVGLLQEQLRSEIAPEKGGGDAESSPSSSTLPRAGKTALTQAELQVQKLEQLLSEMSTEYEQRLVEVKERLGCEKQESIDQIRRQLQKHHTDEINRLIVDHQRELQRLQPAGETSDDDSLIELARKVHVEIDRNEQIDSRMMGYLRRPDAQGVSDVADAAPSSVVAANGQVVHSPDGSTEQATTLQGILRKIHSEGIKKLSPPELHLLRRYGDAASQGDEHHGGWEEERSSLKATIDSLREATGKTQPCLPPSQERLSGNDLTQEVSDLQQQLAALKVTLQGEKERQMEERTRMEEQHKVLENQLRRQVELLEFKVQQEKVVSADLRSSLAAEKVQLSELSGQLSDDRTSGSRLQTELGDTQARVSMLQDALAREQARLASTSCALEEQRRQTGRLNEALVIEKANSAQCLDRLDTEKEHSTEYRERTSHVIQKLKQDMESEKQSHLEAASALERERVAVASLRREVELERDQHRSTQTKYKAKVEQLRTSLELHKARCEELNSALQRERQLGAQLRDILDDERSSQQDISERERAAITDLQALLDVERSKLIELQEALQHERDTVAALNDDLLSVKADFSESLTRERAACRQLKTALETLQAQKEDLKTRVQMSEERLHEVQMDRDRWQTSVLATRPHVHQVEPPFEVTEERDVDRLRQSVSETTRLTQNSAETERLREIERLRETVTHLQSQLAETRRAEVEARETCNLLRLKSAVAPSNGGNAHHQLSNGDKIQDTRLANEGAPPVSHKAVIARKQMESLRQQLQLLCIRLQEELAHSATRSSVSLQRGGVDPVLEVESIKTVLKDILFELQELQTALTSTSQGDSVGRAVPGLNERILSHNSELTAFISRLSAEKQHLRRTLSILEQDLLQQQQQSDRQLEQHASTGDSRERSNLSLQLSHLERELAATQTELHRLQVEREPVLHSPTHTDSTTDRPKLQRLYGRYLKSESFRKALIYQKKYLLVLIGGFQDSEEQTLATIAQMGVYPSGGALQRQLRHAQPFTKFRSAVRAVIAISRLKFLVRKWRRATRGANIGSAPTDRGVAGGIAMTQHSANSENLVARPSERLYQAPPGSSERLYQAPPGSSKRLYQAPPGSSERLYQASPGSRYMQSASVHSSLHTTPPTRERSAESRRVPLYSSPGLAAYSSPGLAPYSSPGLTFNSPTARREMLTALDPMLESTPPPPPSLSDGGAQSPLLSYTDGCDHDNYIERLEHLQLRLGAASRGSLSNNRR